jgi:hypothetical protein
MSHVTLDFINQLASQSHLKVVKVAMPEWGEGKVAYIGQLSADERDDRLETGWVTRKERLGTEGNIGLRAFSVAACLCDEGRNWIANTREEVDQLADFLGKFPSGPVTRLFEPASELNALTKAAVEELEKN